jgi:hypothetical protein
MEDESLNIAIGDSWKSFLNVPFLKLAFFNPAALKDNYKYSESGSYGCP